MHRRAYSVARILVQGTHDAMWRADAVSFSWGCYKWKKKWNELKVKKKVLSQSGQPEESIICINCSEIWQRISTSHPNPVSIQAIVDERNKLLSDERSLYDVAATSVHVHISNGKSTYHQSTSAGALLPAVSYHSHFLSAWACLASQFKLGEKRFQSDKKQGLFQEQCNLSSFDLDSRQVSKPLFMMQLRSSIIRNS